MGRKRLPTPPNDNNGEPPPPPPPNWGWLKRILETIRDKIIWYISPVPHIEYVKQGKDVTTAGTAERLVDDARKYNWREIQIQGKSGNSGQIYIGDETVSSSNCWMELDAKETQIIPMNDPYYIWIDAGTSGDGVWVAGVPQ